MSEGPQPPSADTAAVEALLQDIPDPETGRTLVEMGQIRDIQADAQQSRRSRRLPSGSRRNCRAIPGWTWKSSNMTDPPRRSAASA